MPDQWELVVLGLVEQALLDLLDQIVLGLVVVEAAWAHSDQLEQDLESDLGLQGLEPDLWDHALHPQIDLKH